mmetsp:Transcript_93274/g.221809  ORF Transcript_93274/g.221809 Transcript_93274/m.221809 type:complete len:249 (-) Transcript_93274:167-913(-)
MPRHGFGSLIFLQLMGSNQQRLIRDLGGSCLSMDIHAWVADVILGGVRLAQHYFHLVALGHLFLLGPIGPHLTRKHGAQRAAGTARSSHKQKHPERHLAAGLLQPVAAFYGTAVAIKEGAALKHGQCPILCLRSDSQTCGLRAAASQYGEVPVPDVMHLKQVDVEGMPFALAVQADLGGSLQHLLCARAAIPEFGRLAPAILSTIKACQVQRAIVFHGRLPLPVSSDRNPRRLLPFRRHANAEAPHVP